MNQFLYSNQEVQALCASAAKSYWTLEPRAMTNDEAFMLIW